MNSQEAAGFIETFGFLPAVEAADVCLKTANVSLVSKQNSGAGLVTIIIRGDVGAVKAAIEAATIAADRVGKVVSTHVIARPVTELNAILMGATRSAAPVVESEVESEVESQPDVVAVTEAMETDSSSIVDIDELQAFRTVELRNMARQLQDFTMSKQQIKFAKKDALIQAIVEYHQKVK
ncbi:BMC domain-containing protein [Endozoicomonas sp.]|uniref:BMC domain-containing protein n=1 Tax=Endozoicomonas sp. TaxID=1892382 RepID=UPI00383B8FE8